MEHRDPPKEGEVIAGRYRILELVGAGGMGAVYWAEDIFLERSVAVKVIRSEHVNDPAFHAAFLRESRLAARIKHPNVVRVYDGGDDNGRLYLAMEHVEGSDLGAHIKRAGPLPWEQALKYLWQIASALDRVHSHGLVHGDVKPTNVLIARGHAFLTDFGIARENRVSEAVLSFSTDDAGMASAQGALVDVNSAYMAPEQWLEPPTDHRVDIYALGAVFYTMLTGRPPYDRDGPRALHNEHLIGLPLSPGSWVPSPPAGFGEVVRKAMAMEPDDRYQTGEELVAAAYKLGNAEPSPVRHRGRLARASAVVTVGLAVMLGAVFLRSLGRDQPTAQTTTPPVEAPPAQPPTASFRDELTGSSLEYPSSWQRFQPADPSLRLLLDGGGNVLTTLRVFTSDIPIGAANDADTKALSDEVLAGDTRANVIEYRRLMIDGMPGHYYAYTFTNDDRNLETGASYFLFQGRKMNLLVFQSPASIFENLAAEFDRIAESFRSNVNIVPSNPALSLNRGYQALTAAAPPSVAQTGIFPGPSDQAGSAASDSEEEVKPADVIALPADDPPDDASARDSPPSGPIGSTAVVPRCPTVLRCVGP